MNKPIMGLEVHVQLSTESKLFCGCNSHASEQPNSAVCQVCLGMPGSKPVLNKKAVDNALKIALALNCDINSEFFFSRKTYFYPDMSKNFQITQYEIPLGKNGFIILKSGKKIRIRRVHLEEDPASLVHEGGLGQATATLIDYNRSGCPLVEIVTEPDISSPEEARQLLDHLLAILNYLNVFVLGKDILKVDSNVSLEGGERVEVKNVTGFRSVEKALAFEIARQQNVLAKGEKVKRHTMAFDEETQTTRVLRTKETEEDYGYIFEPDLTMVEIDEKTLNSIKKLIPELPAIKIKRFMEQYGIAESDAYVLSMEPQLSNTFEEVAKGIDAKLAAIYLTKDLMGVIHYKGWELKDVKVEGKRLIPLLKLLNEGKITEKVLKEATIAYVNEGKDPAEFVVKNNLMKDISSNELPAIVGKFLKENPKAIEDYKKGEPKALNFIVGKIMALTKGKAEPREIQKLVSEKIKK